MTPVKQTMTDAHRGDCCRATIASLFDLDIVQVPHFLLFEGYNWWLVYNAFAWALGWEVVGTGHHPKFKPRDEHLADCHVGGFVDACVPSKNYPGKMHSVVMDLDGLVVHDPAPAGMDHYQGVNVIETGELESWTLMKERDGTATDDQYYLQYTAGAVGNDVLWWRQDRCGYTTDLSDAHVFTRAEAFEQQAVRKIDIPRLKADMDAIAHRAVFFHDLTEHELRAGLLPGRDGGD